MVWHECLLLCWNLFDVYFFGGSLVFWCLLVACYDIYVGPLIGGLIWKIEFCYFSFTVRKESIWLTLTNLLMMPTPNFGTKALLVVVVVRKDEVYFRKFVRLRQTDVLDNTYIFKLRVISVILFVLPLCSQHVEDCSGWKASTAVSFFSLSWVEYHFSSFLSNFSASWRSINEYRTLLAQWSSAFFHIGKC